MGNVRETGRIVVAYPSSLATSGIAAELLRADRGSLLLASSPVARELLAFVRSGGR
jgi:hypothetical protein